MPFDGFPALQCKWFINHISTCKKKILTGMLCILISDLFALFVKYSWK